ncbi:hypothetical protein [Streptomyces sp. RKAG293]|uniref:hypothetical protein n=1 Tax=Streptomyces sp. RKAG293 TaxID=2893403 RepID=UPI002034215F|nr:hypothetical protein [Streptomyces sp. RKAG293]MCM2417408.1 hypothetical protein [Streptomyces sp. RKAG293]
MAASTTVPVRHQGSLGVALPVTLGVIYGVWAAFIARGGEGLTAGDIGLGVVAGFAVAVLCFLLGRTQKALPRELRAAAYGTLAGCSVGFLHSLTDESILRCVGMGIGFGAAAAAASYYIFYTHEP